MSHKKFIAKSFFWLSVSEFVFTIAGYVVHTVVGRILGPAEYGRYGLVVTLTTMIIVLISRGIPTAMQKYLSEVLGLSPASIAPIKRRAALLQTILMGIVTALFFFLSPVLAHLLHDPTLTPLFQLSALIIPAFSVASFYVYYFGGLQKFSTQAALKVVRSVARIGFILSFAYFFGITGAIAGYIFAPLAVCIVALGIDIVFVQKSIKKEAAASKPQKTYTDKSFTRSLLSFAWPVTLFLLFYELFIRIDLYLVKALLRDDVATGLYNAAVTLSLIPFSLVYALTFILFPTISKTTAEKDTAKTKRIIRESLRFQMIALFPITLLVALFTQPLISLFFGSAYEETAHIFPIVVAGTSLLAIVFANCHIFNGANKTKISLAIAVCAFLFNFFLNSLLIPHLGILGAAIATTTSATLALLASLTILYRTFSVLPSFKTLLRVGGSTAMLLLIGLFIPKTIFWMFLGGTLLTLLYGVLLWFTKEITQKDLTIIPFGLKK